MAKLEGSEGGRDEEKRREKVARELVPTSHPVPIKEVNVVELEREEKRRRQSTNSRVLLQ